ncbi:hypothetical protein ILUMI_01288 [Ignelater luminosus]|uniref:Farnesoic acid O-methyl transferase domain-containing protein n=1 Tax=Ignelater luminosus TaxID=2038154 RepID=A0A8K0DIN3_IGNLU|nr:hypothetical protein ILUMI_01288 [Ignelater luminosus]
MGDIELNTRDALEYTFYPNNTGYMRFKVRAANDAHVALASAAAECDPMYEIFIGGWGNSKSVIRKNRTKPDKAEVPTPNILNAGEFRSFWIRWDNNTISAGCENNPQPFMSWSDTEHVPIRYVGVCTGWGATGSWLISQGGAPLGGFGGQPQGFGGGSGGFAPPQPYGGQQPPQPYGGQQPQSFGGQQPQPFGGQQPQAFGQSFGGPQAQPYTAPQPQAFGQQPGQQFGGPQQQQFGFQGGFGGANRWVSSNGGNVPPNAFVGGQDSNGEPLYVIRSNFQGGNIPGKLVSSHRTAYVPWGGAENPVPQYEVLCDCNARWVPCSGGNIPPNAITGGTSETGEPLYIGRVQHQGSITCGKVQRSHGTCYIPFGGQEMSFPQYEILIS